MSDLTVYGGNFLNFADSEFSSNFNPNVQKTFNAVDGLELNVSSHVGIFPSTSNTVTIEIDAEDPNDFSISYEGYTVNEKSKGGSNNVVINSWGGGRSVTSFSGNVSIINGRIYQNGVEINPDQPSSPPKRQSRIRVFAPHGVDLSAKLDGVSVLASKVVFRKSNIKVSGSATVGIATKSLKLKLSGQGENFAVLKGGELNVSLSGQGSVKVKGDYESADVTVSGQGNIVTDGNCLGDYEACVSGMGRIVHTGVINGRKRKSVTGMGSISI
jgi:hypothetical protein